MLLAGTISCSSQNVKTARNIASDDNFPSATGNNELHPMLRGGYFPSSYDRAKLNTSQAQAYQLIVQKIQEAMRINEDRTLNPFRAMEYGPFLEDMVRIAPQIDTPEKMQVYLVFFDQFPFAPLGKGTDGRITASDWRRMISLEKDGIRNIYDVVARVYTKGTKAKVEVLHAILNNSDFFDNIDLASRKNRAHHIYPARAVNFSALMISNKLNAFQEIFEGKISNKEAARWKQFIQIALGHNSRASSSPLRDVEFDKIKSIVRNSDKTDWNVFVQIMTDIEEEFSSDIDHNEKLAKYNSRMYLYSREGKNYVRGRTLANSARDFISNNVDLEKPKNTLLSLADTVETKEAFLFVRQLGELSEQLAFDISSPSYQLLKQTVFLLNRLDIGMTQIENDRRMEQLQAVLYRIRSENAMSDVNLKIFNLNLLKQIADGELDRVHPGLSAEAFEAIYQKHSSSVEKMDKQFSDIIDIISKLSGDERRELKYLSSSELKAYMNQVVTDLAEQKKYNSQIGRLDAQALRALKEGSSCADTMVDILARGQ